MDMGDSTLDGSLGGRRRLHFCNASCNHVCVTPGCGEKLTAAAARSRYVRCSRCRKLKDGPADAGEHRPGRMGGERRRRTSSSSRLSQSQSASGKSSASSAGRAQPGPLPGFGPSSPGATALAAGHRPRERRSRSASFDGERPGFTWGNASSEDSSPLRSPNPRRSSRHELYRGSPRIMHRRGSMVRPPSADLFDEDVDMKELYSDRNEPRFYVSDSSRSGAGAITGRPQVPVAVSAQPAPLTAARPLPGYPPGYRGHHHRPGSAHSQPGFVFPPSSLRTVDGPAAMHGAGSSTGVHSAIPSRIQTSSPLLDGSPVPEMMSPGGLRAADALSALPRAVLTSPLINPRAWWSAVDDMTYDGPICQTCQTAYEDDEEDLLLCSVCRTAFHASCEEPELDWMPTKAFCSRRCFEQYKQGAEGRRVFSDFTMLGTGHLRRLDASFTNNQLLALRAAPGARAAATPGLAAGEVKVEVPPAPFQVGECVNLRATPTRADPRTEWPAVVRHVYRHRTGHPMIFVTWLVPISADTQYLPVPAGEEITTCSPLACFPYSHPCFSVNCPKRLALTAAAATANGTVAGKSKPPTTAAPSKAKALPPPKAAAAKVSKGSKPRPARGKKEKGGAPPGGADAEDEPTVVMKDGVKMIMCTCGRLFKSGQALGGHRGKCKVPRERQRDRDARERVRGTARPALRGGPGTP